ELVGECGEAALEALSATQMAGHVAAYLDIGCRAGRQAVQGIETGDLVQPMQGHAEPLRQGAQFGFGQVAAAVLDSMEFLHNHGALPTASSFLPCKNASMSSFSFPFGARPCAPRPCNQASSFCERPCPWW